MAAPTEVYVDPSLDANSGSGTLVDPYGDLQYALDTKTRDSTNGDRFNIKAGATETLSAVLSLATYGSPLATAPLIFQGYNAAAGDGGIGDISGGGAASILNDSRGHIIARNLKLHNVGNRPVWQSSGNYCLAEGCEVYDTTGSSGNGIVLTGSGSAAYRNYVHDIAGVGITAIFCDWNTLVNGAINKFVTAIEIANTGAAQYNLIVLSGPSNGIKFEYGSRVIGNAIYSVSGTGTGISSRGSGRYWADVLNNLVEGFSGTGGKGLDIAGSFPLRLVGYNRFYNCATAVSAGAEIYLLVGSNSTLGASPFTNAAGNDFTPVAAVQGAAYPTTFPSFGTGNYRDIGAIQHQDSGGGGGAANTGINLGGIGQTGIGVF